MIEEDLRSVKKVLRGGYRRISLEADVLGLLMASLISLEEPATWLFAIPLGLAIYGSGKSIEDSGRITRELNEPPAKS